MTTPINTMDDARAMLSGHKFMTSLMDKVDATKTEHEKADAMRVLAGHINTMMNLDASGLMAAANKLSSAQAAA